MIKIRNMAFTTKDIAIMIEFALVVLASFCFLGGLFAYVTYGSTPIWLWFSFALFILVKNWVEFYESYEDRRDYNIPDDEKLPFMCRRQAD